MTFLPSLGLSLCLAYLAHQCLAGLRERSRRGWLAPLQWIGLGVISLLSFVEIVTLSSLVKQAEEARAFDQVITDQIYAIQPGIHKGAEVFVTMLMPSYRRIERYAPSGYIAGGGFAALPYQYRTDVNDIKYSAVIRRSRDAPNAGFYALAERYGSVDRSRIFPFLVNEDLSVMAIKSVIISDEDGRVVEELKFPSMDNAKSDRLISVRIASAKGR
jgi:hypothetical protein